MDKGAQTHSSQKRQGTRRPTAWGIGAGGRRSPFALHLVTTLLASASINLALTTPASAIPAYCGPPQSAGKGITFYYDYTDKSANNNWHLRDVYYAHFVKDILDVLKWSNPSVQRMLSGLTYILVRIPNDYRALEMYSRLYKRYPKMHDAIKIDADRNQSRPMTPECVFARAFRMHPDDPVPRLLYGLFFHRTGNLDGALKQYRIAAKMRPDWPEVHYNMGLVYLKQKNYAAARKHAKKAYARGYPLPALRDNLKQAGHWP